MSKEHAPFRVGQQGMRRNAAAAYLGISPGHFDKLVDEGLMPAPRDCSGVKLWVRDELDEALFSLPTYGTEGGASSCDEVFAMFG